MAVQSVVAELQRCTAHRGQQVAAQRDAPVGNLVRVKRAEEKRHVGLVWGGCRRTLWLSARLRWLHLLAVDVVNERVNDVSEDEGPRSSQAVLHLYQQQVNKQVVHEEDAMALVAVGGFRRSFTHGQQNPLD